MNRSIDFRHDLKKYWDYIFETKGFRSNCHVWEISDQATQAVQTIRGRERGPAIIIQGVMPRSGTVYIGELLRCHPDLYVYPHQLWEFPALQLTENILDLQKKFLLGYKLNSNKLGQADFLPLVGASLMAYLYEPVPPPQRVLVKMPSVQYLSHFFSMFPSENLLILVRDGRDLVHSTLRTWPWLNFFQVCLRWNRSAQMICETVEQLTTAKRNGYWLAKYEDALQNPETFVQKACHYFNLDENRYPYEQIDHIRVIGSSKLENQGKVTWRHLKRPENFTPTEYWKEWSSIRKLIFKLIAGRSLIRLGYCDNLNW